MHTVTSVTQSWLLRTSSNFMCDVLVQSFATFDTTKALASTWYYKISERARVWRTLARTCLTVPNPRLVAWFGCLALATARIAVQLFDVRVADRENCTDARAKVLVPPFVDAAQLDVEAITATCVRVPALIAAASLYEATHTLALVAVPALAICARCISNTLTFVIVVR